MSTPLKLGINVGYWQRDPDDQTETVLAAERLGYDFVFTAEAYGSDALTTLTWYAARTSRIKLGTAVVQMSARTPAATAMHALTLDALSGGRLILGLGASGPQVVEGWYGVPFPKPLARTREYIDILRKIWRREGPVTSPGPHYPLPYPGGTGLGKPLKSIVHPIRSDIPIYLGAEGPKNVALAAEIAQGWLPLFVDPAQIDSVFGESLAGRPDDFEIAATVTVIVNDDLQTALEVAKIPLAFYIGGMGAKERNFHLDLIGRLGYAEQAAKVQELFLSGRRDEAIKAVPDELADSISLVGPIGRIRERLQLWRDSPVTTLLIAGVRDEPTLRAIRDAVYD
ncbi:MULTISPECIES: LLM class F420-dependent oxidoreductase [Thermomonospora]|uniref:Luciferase-like monooxygenase n=1 Tax=Thermomonospora curvata (strain ATCC 19995 / DSM 43183 / JCM 3096 / KCTC 9072 / NBRC 15933 / NCIMB 10081 / Henssen B9) TaxID=471852 RepID=D1A9J0_THECD|nr:MULTISPECIES: LLM class F420-dependent oxidoreductase [Thermomonospora]ACY96886.1 Luciferase-like monooxygenase [Thermomonospora curvata DSM 43183]PKK15172.1 MAG: LLM class F420-dependent oxidoreductase [Thermomonospora sp. CIF 1]